MVRGSMYAYEDIRVVHLEMTSRCNSACPMCARNLQGGATNPNLPLTELSETDIRTMFPEEFVGRLKRMYMCGNYGDAMVARDTREVFAYFRAVNPKVHLRLITNGSGRKPEWWQGLAKIVDVTTFSIDGLEDTNHLYRRHTDWDVIMRSVEAYIGAGGKADWDFIVFKHNEHQVEAARELSQKLGFQKFTAKRTDRFMSRGKLVNEKPVYDRDGSIAYQLEMPVGPEYQNTAVRAVDSMVKQGTQYTDYAGETDVVCKATGEAKIYASAEGLVFPCCWVGGIYSSGVNAETGEMWPLMRALPEGKQALSALRRPLREVIEGSFFQSLIPATWVPGSKERKDFTLCARMCGKHDTVRATPLPPTASA
ncbi:MAG: radical SAM protein [Myxococcota bacterium]